MLSVSLVLSLLLLLTANVIVWRSSAGTLAGLAGALGIVMLYMALAIFSAVVLLQLAVLVPAGILWHCKQWRLRCFALASASLTLAAYLVVGWFAYQEVREWQVRFPYVSMEARLPQRPAIATSIALTAAASDHLEFLELEVDDKHRSWRAARRLETLQQMHEDTVQVFVGSPGFGVMRMSGMESKLRSGFRAESPLPQPVAGTTLAWSSEYLTEPASNLDNDAADKLRNMHRSSVLDFVHPAGFGYIKDRRHVAGFQSHQFSELPPSSNGWRLQTLHLIGLVLHEQPTVYVSAHLPHMDELREVPRRPLDDFETLGLQALRNGEDLFVRDGPGGRRLLGAIRSARQCLACHEGERGDLLGAFAYTLARTE